MCVVTCTINDQLEKVRGDRGDGVEVGRSRLLRGDLGRSRARVILHGRRIIRGERPGEERRRRRPPRQGRVPVPSPAAATAKTNNAGPERNLAALVEGRTAGAASKRAISPKKKRIGRLNTSTRLRLILRCRRVIRSTGRPDLEGCLSAKACLPLRLPTALPFRYNALCGLVSQGPRERYVAR